MVGSLMFGVNKKYLRFSFDSDTEIKFDCVF